MQVKIEFKLVHKCITLLSNFLMVDFNLCSFFYIVIRYLHVGIHYYYSVDILIPSSCLEGDFMLSTGLGYEKGHMLMLYVFSLMFLISTIKMDKMHKNSEKSFKDTLRYSAML